MINPANRILILRAVTLIISFNCSEISAQFSEISILPGVHNTYSEGATASDFLKLAPQSTVLQNELSGFQSSTFGTYYGNSAFAISLGMPLRKEKEEGKKSRAILRLGFTFLNTSGLSAYYSKQSTTRIDTLVSSQSGQLSFVDSVRSQNYSMNYNTQQLRLDASIVFRWNDEKRWSLYAGAGLSAGFSLNSTTNIYYYEINSVRVRVPSGNVSNTESPFTVEQQNGYTETFRNKTSYGAMLYIPLGIDFRLGKEKEFWKLLHLFYEIRPSADVTVVPELGGFATASFMHGIGLRAAW
jgi:hypothetical protein